MTLPINSIICADCLEVMKDWPDESINCCISSPPYWSLRSYGGWDMQIVWGSMDEFAPPRSARKLGGGRSRWMIMLKVRAANKGGVFSPNKKTWIGALGLEPTFELYIKHLCDIYDEVFRVLRKDGTCWINLGDTFWGGKGQSGRCDHNIEQRIAEGRTFQRREYTLPTRHCPQNGKHDTVQAKSLCLIPYRFAIEMVNRGWILRNIIIWSKPNPMPSSAKDRFTVDFEPVFFFTKNKKYFFEPQYEANSLNTHPYAAGGQFVKEKFGDGTKCQKAITESKVKAFPPAQNPLGRNKRTTWTIQDPAYFVNWLKANQPDFLIQMYQYMKEAAQEVYPQAVWTIPTQPTPEAHFATFPEDLVRPMVKAGCPRYVCKKCGKPRVKIYEKGNLISDQHGGNTNSGIASRQPMVGDWNSGKENYGPNMRYEQTFKGYSDCGCNAGWAPGVVLDPFVVQLAPARWQQRKVWTISA